MNNNTSAELLTAGKWTEFLKSLPLGVTDWVVDGYNRFNNLRVTATLLNKDMGYERKFSINVSPQDDMKIYIKVERKKQNGNS